MTTTPTERRLAITKGTWTAQNILRVTRMGRMPKVVGPDGQLIVEFMGGELDEVEANAELIADAGTTFNTCGLTPSELLAKVRELAKAFEQMDETSLEATIDDDPYDAVQFHLTIPEDDAPAIRELLSFLSNLPQ